MAESPLTPLTATPPVLETRTEVDSSRRADLDLLRGGAIVLMAIDHLHHFLLPDVRDPLDPSTTNLVRYFFRWITHPAAPAFVFLAGIAVALALPRSTSRGAMSKLLVVRGLWLLILELLLFTVVWTGRFDYRMIILQVLWAFSIAFVVLAFMIHLPAWVSLLTGLILVTGHNLIPSMPPSSTGWGTVARSLLLENRILEVAPEWRLAVVYPAAPWAGVALLGYSCGVLWFHRPDVRLWARWTGIIALLLLLILRAGNFYGEPVAWTFVPSRLHTIYSFLNLSKYPPSFQFLLLTLGANLIIWSILPHRVGAWGQWLVDLGRTPLFFYLLHPFVVIPLAWLAHMTHRLLIGMDTSRLLMSHPVLDLSEVILGTILVILILLPLCRWFARVKKNHPRNFWLKIL